MTNIVQSPVFIPIESSSCSETFQADMAICQTYESKAEIRACINQVKDNYSVSTSTWVFGGLIVLLAVTIIIYVVRD